MDPRQQPALTFAGGSGQKPSPLNQAKKKKKKEKQTFNRKNRKHQVNIATKFCLAFCRTGLCKKGVNCPFSHTPEKVAICKNFLYDNCKVAKCFLSHTSTPDNMPDCNLFLKGFCKEESCRYRHVKVNADAGICKDFETGFCSKGAQCESLHPSLCKAFFKKGKCPRGEICTRAHLEIWLPAQAVVEINSPQPSDMMAAQPSITTPTWSQIVSRESRNPQTSSGGDGAAASENLAVFLAEAGTSATDLKKLSKSSDVCFKNEKLAKLLQRELDLEHDRRVKAEEKKYNAHSRVKLSFKNQLYLKKRDLHNSDLKDKESYHEYGEASQYWDFFEKMEKSAPAIGRTGFSVDKKSGRVTTKHDIERARNACKMMEFKSDIRTGDGGGFPMKLNNSVCNALRVHSISMARLHKKREKSSLQLAEDFYRHRPRRPRRRTTVQVEDGSRLFHSNELYEL